MTPNIADIIRHHVSLEVRCLDRIDLHAYLPKLQTSGGLCCFLRDHLGAPIPSPALLRPRHDAFVAAVERVATQHDVPVLTFDPRARKDDVVAPYRRAFTARDGVVVLGVAQEKAWSFKASKQRTPGGGVTFDFSRQWAHVKHYYFYVHDREWGPGFLKICTVQSRAGISSRRSFATTSIWAGPAAWACCFPAGSPRRPRRRHMATAHG